MLPITITNTPFLLYHTVLFLFYLITISFSKLLPEKKNKKKKPNPTNYIQWRTSEFPLQFQCKRKWLNEKQKLQKCWTKNRMPLDNVGYCHQYMLLVGLSWGTTREQERDFCPDIREKLFPLTVVRPWQRLPKEAAPYLWSVQGQAGWTLKQAGILEGIPAHSRRWSKMILKVSSNTDHAGILCLYKNIHTEQRMLHNVL